MDHLTSASLDEPLHRSETGAGTLTPADVREFQIIMREECGVELDDAAAWERARELANLYRMLLGPIPEDPGAPSGSNVVPLAPLESGKVS